MISERRAVAALASLLLATLVFLGCPNLTDAASAAGPPTGPAQVGGFLVIRPAAPIKRELVRLTGTLVTAVKRPVLLQIAGRDDTFHTVAYATTNAGGRFSYTEIVPPRDGPTYVRVLAPPVRVGTTSYVAIRTSTVRTRVQVQAAVLTFGTSTATTTAAPGVPFSATAAFTPVRRGRPVEIQRLDAGVWVTVAKGQQNTNGQLTTTLTEATAGMQTYRAFTAQRKGAASTTSTPVTVTIAAPAG